MTYFCYVYPYSVGFVSLHVSAGVVADQSSPHYVDQSPKDGTNTNALVVAGPYICLFPRVVAVGELLTIRPVSDFSSIRTCKSF